MYRCYCAEADITQTSILIKNQRELHHLRNVLRLKVSDALVVFDGKGTEYQGTVDQLSVHEMVVRVESVCKHVSERPLLILACAIPKNGKFETIIEKCTELGVDEIIPLRTKRTEVILKGDALERKKERFQSVAVSAAKQCRRPTVPAVHSPLILDKALDDLRERTVVLMPSLQGDRKPVLDVLSSMERKHAVSFLIGPEGDFTPEEYADAWKRDAVPVSLGSTVLRVETAAISVIAVANFIFDRCKS